jgi:hypothetical protein
LVNEAKGSAKIRNPQNRKERENKHVEEKLLLMPTTMAIKEDNLPEIPRGTMGKWNDCERFDLAGESKRQLNPRAFPSQENETGQTKTNKIHLKMAINSSKSFRNRFIQ